MASRTTERLTSKDWQSTGSGGSSVPDGYRPETIPSTSASTTTTLKRAGRPAIDHPLPSSRMGGDRRPACEESLTPIEYQTTYVIPKLTVYRRMMYRPAAHAHHARRDLRRPDRWTAPALRLAAWTARSAAGWRGSGAADRHRLGRGRRCARAQARSRQNPSGHRRPRPARRAARRRRAPARVALAPRLGARPHRRAPALHPRARRHGLVGPGRPGRPPADVAAA